MDLLDKFKGLKQKRDEFEKEKVILETRIASLEEEKKKLEEVILMKFKVLSIDEAKQKSEVLKQKIEGNIVNLTEKLNEYQRKVNGVDLDAE